MISQVIKENIPLAPLTTFKIGGPAKYFVTVKTADELRQAVAWAREHKEKTCILGGGSNVLVNDRGVDGLVIRLANDELAIRGERLECGAGANLARAAGIACGAGLSGLEWAHGIPGATVGGAVCGNAGAFGRQMDEFVETAEVYPAGKDEFELLSNKECRFGYRHSVFKDNPGLYLWRVALKMERRPAAEIGRITEEVMAFRGSKQPKSPSAGSVFRNLDPEDIKRANEGLYRELTKSGVRREGKIGAGRLIERAGLKGRAIGGAKISLEHANFIVNTGHATADDVAALISLVKQQIRDKFGLQLREEIVYFGFD